MELDKKGSPVFLNQDTLGQAYKPGATFRQASLVAQWWKGDTGSIPGLERSPGEGDDNPLQYSCLENSMDRGAWRATVHGVVRVGHNWASEHTHTHPLQIQQEAASTTGTDLPSPVVLTWGRVDSINASKGFHTLVRAYWTEKGEEEGRDLFYAYMKKISHSCPLYWRGREEHCFLLQWKRLKLRDRIRVPASSHQLCVMGHANSRIHDKCVSEISTAQHLCECQIMEQLLENIKAFQIKGFYYALYLLGWKKKKKNTHNRPLFNNSWIFVQKFR